MQPSRPSITGLAVLPAANCTEPTDAYLSTNKSSYLPLETVFIEVEIQSNLTFNGSSLLFEITQPGGPPFFLDATPSGNNTFYAEYVQVQDILLGDYSARVLLDGCYLNATPHPFSIYPPPIFMGLSGRAEYLPGGISLFVQVYYQNGSSAGSPDFGLVVLDDSARERILFPAITPLETGYDISFSLRTPGSYTAVLTALKDGASATARMAFEVVHELKNLTLDIIPGAFEANRSGFILLNSSLPARVQLEVVSPSGTRTFFDNVSDGLFFTPVEEGAHTINATASLGDRRAHASAIFGVSPRTARMVGTLKDFHGAPLAGTISIRGEKFEARSGETFNFTAQSGKYDVSLQFDNFLVSRVDFTGFELFEDVGIPVELQELKSVRISGKKPLVAFMLNPASNCSLANVTFSYAKASSPSLFKCSDWDDANSACSGSWVQSASLPAGPAVYSHSFACSDPAFAVVDLAEVKKQVKRL